MLVSAFAVGALVNLFGSRGRVARAEEEKPATSTAAKPERDPLGDLNLVPVTSAAAGSSVITSAPMPNVNAAMPMEAERTGAGWLKVSVGGKAYYVESSQARTDLKLSGKPKCEKLDGATGHAASRGLGEQACEP